jgi:hypothetical protein
VNYGISRKLVNDKLLTRISVIGQDIIFLDLEIITYLKFLSGRKECYLTVFFFFTTQKGDKLRLPARNNVTFKCLHHGKEVHKSIHDAPSILLSRDDVISEVLAYDAWNSQ